MSQLDEPDSGPVLREQGDKAGKCQGRQAVKCSDEHSLERDITEGNSRREP